MSPMRRPHSLAEHYDQTLRYTHDKRLPPGHPKPQPTAFWPKENIELYERYRNWLLSGGASELASKIIYLSVAGHVLGLSLKPHPELNLETDFQRALEYVIAKQSSPDWIQASRNGLNKFRRFLRLERGLGEESNITPFDSARAAAGLPGWLVEELNRYQRQLQRNWREARFEQYIRQFWSGHLRLWRFFAGEKKVQALKELKRQHILDYIDLRLGKGYAVAGVNHDLRSLHTFLLFLQQQGYRVPLSLLSIPSLQMPDPLPRYLTDEQMRKLREEVEQAVSEAKLASHRRLALLVRAVFYLLWQGGMRASEVEEVRLEDLDISTSLNASLPQNRLSVRDGKGKKDRTVYLTETAMHALQEYLAVRGEGSGDHVFLYRHAPLKRGLIHNRLKASGERVGLKVHPHRLRHTCATQLLNAGCRVTSIQRFLGHRDLASTLVYARVHDQTVADDYFTAMQRVEERLQIGEVKNYEVVKVQEPEKLFQLIEQLEVAELCLEERLEIASQLRDALGKVRRVELVETNEHAPPMEIAEDTTPQYFHILSKDTLSS